MQNHAVELVKKGFQVSVHGISDKFTNEDADGWGGAPLHPVKPLWARFALAPELGKDLRASSPDIVHQHGLWQYPSIAVASWRRQSRGKVVISTQGMLEPWALSQSRNKKRLAASAFERANLTAAAVIHCSPAELAGIRAFGLRNPVAVIPNGARLPEAGKTDLPDLYPYTHGFRVMLFLGRLHPKKGIAESLSAWAAAKTMWPELANTWKFVIAGWDDGDHEETLKACASQLGLDDDVMFVGPVFGLKKAALFQHSNAFILPSFSEGFPMAILEAWSYGLPVFMTRHCNIPVGFSARAAVEIDTDPETIAQVLVRNLPDPELQKKGRRGYDLVRREFDWQQLVSELGNVYHWIAGDLVRPDFVDIA